MRRAGEQDGFTLVELLVAMTIGLAAFAGVVGALTVMLRQSSLNRSQAEAQSAVRTTQDLLAVRLRNSLASPGAAPATIERALPYDLIFQTIDTALPAVGSANPSNAMRVRYCLDNADPANATLRSQTQRWTSDPPPATPTDTACPGAGWDTNRVEATNVVNRIDGQDRKIFRCWPTSTTDPTLCPPEPTIRSVETSLFVDVNPTDTRGARELTTGVTLRNANRPPVASFTFSFAGGYVILNASSSTDPDGDALTYQWYYGTSAIPGATSVEYQRAGLPSGDASFKLVVTDRGGLSTEITKLVPVP